MKDNEFSLPPISSEGEQIPFKELNPEQSQTEVQPAVAGPETGKKEMVKKNRIIVILGIVLVIAVAVLIFLLTVVLRPKKAEQIKPTPMPQASPILEATPSGELIKNVIERRNKLKDLVENLDLEEIDLTFPSLDFDIDY